MNGWKRTLALALGLLTLGNCRAGAEQTGQVVAGECFSIVAPMDGAVQIDLEPGQWLSTGEAVGQIEYAQVYAPVSGRVAKIFLDKVQ